MRIAICDDEIAFVESVKRHLMFYSQEHNIEFDIHIFTKSNDLLNSKEKFNIAILDVEIPDCDGIEIGKRLRERNKHIVLMYITAHKKYLDAALNLNAARFFEKPIDSKRFYEGLDNAVKRIDNTTINIFLKDNNASIRINADEIIYIEIDPLRHRKTKIITENKEYVSPNKIEYWEENLINTVFIRTHKSYIINLNYVTKYEHNCLELDHKYIVPVSRNYQASFNKTFIRFMAGV